MRHAVCMRARVGHPGRGMGHVVRAIRVTALQVIHLFLDLTRFLHGALLKKGFASRKVYIKIFEHIGHKVKGVFNSAQFTKKYESFETQHTYVIPYGQTTQLTLYNTWAIGHRPTNYNTHKVGLPASNTRTLSASIAHPSVHTV